MKMLFWILGLSAWLPWTMAAEASAALQEDRAAVVNIVQKFFDALHAKDGPGLRAICQPGAQFTSGRPSADGYAVRQRPVEVDIARFAETKDTYLERMWSPTVQINGRIAVVWTRYDFHLGEKFSHNGTDCFTLLKTDQGWKIVCGAYSVEPGTKTENPAGPPR